MNREDEITYESALCPAAKPLRAEMPWLWGALAFLGLVLCAVAIWPVQAEAFSQEGGLIETVSAIALFTASLAALVRFPGIKRLYIGIVCLLLTERELESDIYEKGSLPFLILDGLDGLLDITVVRIVLAIIVVGGLIWHGIPNGWRAVKARAPFLVVFVLAGTTTVVAQGLEAISSAYSAEMSVNMIARLFVMEEALEMFFSIGILASVLIGWPKTRIEETSNDTYIRSGPDAG